MSTSEDKTEVTVQSPMILKLEKICRSYIDQVEKGEEAYDMTKFMIMMVFSSTSNTEYRTKLFNIWPDYLEDFDKLKPIFRYRYPETLCDEFLSLKLDKNVRILDVACGPGNVAYILKNDGYTNIDGLDPSQGFLDAAQRKKLYRNVINCYVTPDEQTPIAEGTYDVLLCSAGMFPGSIVPQAFKELIRVVKPGGYLIWNIADDYQGFQDFYKDYDSTIKDLETRGIWKFERPVKKLENMLFDDSGLTYLMRKN